MPRALIASTLLALAACAAPAATETTSTVEDAPGVQRGSQDAALATLLVGDGDGEGGEMHVGISRPIVVSVGGNRVEHESLCMEWIMEVQAELGKHFNGNGIQLSRANAEDIVRSIPLPPNTEMRIRFDTTE